MPLMPPPHTTTAIAIIGGGVAGMSCALWLNQLGFTPVIIEKMPGLGGQLQQLNRLNRWVLGAMGMTSTELACHYADHINQEAISVLTATHMLAIDKVETGFKLHLETSNITFDLAVRACVIATGARILDAEQFHGIPGFLSLFDNKLISFNPLAHLDFMPNLKNQVIAVIGGGDNAHFTAKDLALAGVKVMLLMRTKPKAAKKIRHAVELLVADGRVIEYTDCKIKSFQAFQSSVEVTFQRSGMRPESIRVDRLFARIGFAANIEFLADFAVFSGIVKEHGYLKVNAEKQTSIPLVYAIGDVANAKYQSVVNAMADGAIAAKSISEQIEL